MLSDSSALLPASAYERDPTVDYKAHRAALHTMATCHSLRMVNGEYLGDPLDLKMFEYTGWSFEENDQKTNLSEDDESENQPTPVARPPPGLDYDIDESYDSTRVCSLCILVISRMLISISRLNWLS